MALGNVYTYAGTGLTFRVGYNIPDDGGPPRIRYGLPGSASVTQASGNKLGIYAFAGVEGRAVARNIFIDGNSFRNSHRVNGKTLVGDVTVGFALLFGNRPVRMTYSFTWRSKEFDGQDGADKFGSVSVTLTY